MQSNEGSGFHSGPSTTAGAPSQADTRFEPSTTDISSGPGTIAGQAKGFVQEATGKAADLIDQIKDKASAAAEAPKAGLADQIEGLAGAVHQSGEQFKGQQDWIASAVERGASELSSLATALRDNDLGTLVRQVQGFARQQPALFIGASFAAGFALARFGKIVAADVSRDDLPTLPEISRGER